MSEWALKRFWTEARAEPDGGGWAVLLDGRPVHTPARAPLRLPTEALARAVAAEWAAQEGEVRPDRMPLTRASNSAIDKVTPRRPDVAEALLDYGETDLVCYRAEAPGELAQRQAEAWDPLLDWARSALGAPLVATTGIMHVAQPDRARQGLRDAVAGQDAFALTALHDLVTLSGSLVIGLAAQRGVLETEDLWTRSRIDETWQERQWGRDSEAARAARAKRADFLCAAEFHALSRPAAR
jgi:chaperone required for assembly of F1-ATPase